jgi:hypothetical protein
LRQSEVSRVPFGVSRTFQTVMAGRWIATSGRDAATVRRKSRLEVAIYPAGSGLSLWSLLTGYQLPITDYTSSTSPP